MEAIAAFGLACNVIQVVDFSTKVAAKCKELYKDGASSENKDIESMAKHLTDLSTGLKSPSAVQRPGSVPHSCQDEQDLQDLQELAQKCSGTATELIGEIQKLCIHDRRKKRDVLRKAVKVIWEKDAIEDIQKRLEKYRSALDTRILINLRHRVHLLSNDQSTGFGNLDLKLQNFITGLARDQVTFNELKDLIQAQGLSSRQHVSQEFEKHREQLAAHESYKRILESLYFPDIHARQEGIAEAHRQTFEWIFDESGSQIRPWDDFIEWLERGHGSYWISGKAGSGKSTLMNLICQDSRTEAALRVWSGTNEIFMPKFFFWSPGTQLQKSLAGLLRSLIYQIMDKFPELMPMVTSTMGLAQHKLQQLPTWTEHRLRTTLQQLLSNGLEAYRLCIFIDGLDEYHGNRDELLDLIRDLRGNLRVKFCLSSRPYQSFSDEFESSAMLKLQDLTKPDIRKFISDKLGRAPLKVSQVPNPSEWLDETLDEIARKAQGVFLWVTLAVRDQLEGIRNGDDAGQLEERLEALPEEIEALYSHMLRGIDKLYSKEVAQYLQLVVDRPGLSLIALALAVHRRIDDILSFSPEISISDIRNHCEFTRKRLAATCKGFLEVQEHNDFNVWQEREASEIFSKSLENHNIPLEERGALIEIKHFHENTRVDFLHRTAFDFFEANEQGKGFLEANTSVYHDHWIMLFKATLAELRIFSISMDYIIPARIEQIMDEANKLEYETGDAQVALMDLLDRSVAMLYQRREGHLTGFHWCKVWCRNSDLPVDFLGFAAFSGVHRYVELKFDSQSECRNRSNANYLLSCAVDGLRINYDRPILKLVSALLKRGADPNSEIPKGTVWGVFLETMHDLWIRNIDDDDGEDWENTLRTFFESGVNVTQRVCYTSHFFLPYKTHLSSPRRLKSDMVAVTLELSALSVLQHCFGDSPEYLELQDAMIASGASSYSKCTDLQFEVSGSEHPRWLNSKVSKEQMILFSHALAQFLRALAEGRTEKGRAIQELIGNLFQEANIEQQWEEALLKVVEEENDDDSFETVSTKSTLRISNSDAEEEEEEEPSHSPPASETDESPHQPNQVVTRRLTV